jgi:hypothetical protein
MIGGGRRTAIAVLVLSVFSSAAAGAESGVPDPTGFYLVPGDRPDRPQSVIAVYRYGGKLFGRIVMNFDPETGRPRDTWQVRRERAEALDGKPYMVGLDILWGLTERNGKWVGGRVMDPRNGNTFACDAWLDEAGNLVLYGKIWIFGRSMTWTRFAPESFPSGAAVPDPKSFVPVVRER